MVRNSIMQTGNSDKKIVCMWAGVCVCVGVGVVDGGNSS